jgi:diaminohydroxyphosphoribosylaminopyrimidine deaminase/5-amino-6-(5-phosphoribosylamino)uracil reductase
MLDPNPLVNGKGLAVLRSAGLDTRTGLLAESAARLNEAYVKFMRTGRPFVTIKVAQTLDGRIAAANGNARWITSASSRQAARGMRGEAQALIVGSRTALRDDPLLLPAPRRRRGYYRCILDTHLALAPTSRLASTARRYPVIAYCARPRGRTSRELAGRRAILEAMGVVVEPVGTGPDGLLDLEEVARDLATRKVMHIWVEGGGAVFTSFLMRHMVDKVITFIAPKIMGGGGSVESVGDLGVRAPDRSHLLAVDGVSCVGDDLVVVAYPNARGRRAAARGRRSAAAGTNRGGKSAKASRGLRWEHV